jgi:hypothetical protein
VAEHGLFTKPQGLKLICNNRTTELEPFLSFSETLACGHPLRMGKEEVLRHARLNAVTYPIKKTV